MNLESILNKHRNKYSKEFQENYSDVIILEAMREAVIEAIRLCNDQVELDRNNSIVFSEFFPGNNIWDVLNQIE